MPIKRQHSSQASKPLEAIKPSVKRAASSSLSAKRSDEKVASIASKILGAPSKKARAARIPASADGGIDGYWDAEEKALLQPYFDRVNRR